MKQGSITYRLYKPSDKAEFIRCIEKMQDYFVTLDTLGWQRRRKDFGPRYVNEKLLADLKKYSGELHVAMDGKKMVGFIFGTIENMTGLDLSYFKPERVGWIYVLFVDHDYRNKKIGTALMKRLESFFASEGCTLVRLEAQGNVDQLATFYSRHGFKPWQLHMVKRLAKRRNRKTRVKTA